MDRLSPIPGKLYKNLKSAKIKKDEIVLILETYTKYNIHDDNDILVTKVMTQNKIFLIEYACLEWFHWALTEIT